MRALRAPRGFSMVEAVVALTLLAFLSALVSWSLAAVSTARAAHTTRAMVAEVVAAELAAVTSAGPDLLTGDFTVPDRCQGASAGIDGLSCARRGSQVVTVAYRFTAPGDQGTCPGTSADPAAVLAEHGAVWVQACATSVSSAAFTGQAPAPVGGAVQTVAVTPTTPGQVPAGRVVAVHLDGGVGDLAGRPVLLVDAADPTVVAGQAEVTGQIARIQLPGVDTDPVCTPARPCRVALSATPTPDVTVDGEPAVQVTTATRPVSVADRTTVHTWATLTQVVTP